MWPGVRHPEARLPLPVSCTMCVTEQIIFFRISESFRASGPSPVPGDPLHWSLWSRSHGLRGDTTLKGRERSSGRGHLGLLFPRESRLYDSYPLSLLPFLLRRGGTPTPPPYPETSSDYEEPGTSVMLIFRAESPSRTSTPSPPPSRTD